MRARVDVDRHLVAVAKRGDRAALRRLGRDVADHQPAGRAREAPVGQQRDLLAEALADDRRRDLEHLAHSGAAGWALVADHDDVAGLDLLVLDGAKAVLLGLEHPRRARLPERSVPASFTTEPSGARLPRRIARPPSGFSGIGHRANDLLARAPRAASAASSPIVRPVTVIASACRIPASASRLRISGTPPAR